MGVMNFGISEGKGGGGGLKYGSHLWLGMDIFWNCPIFEQGTYWCIERTFSGALNLCRIKLHSKR